MVAHLRPSHSSARDDPGDALDRAAHLRPLAERGADRRADRGPGGARLEHQFLASNARNNGYQQSLAAANRQAEQLKELIAPGPDRPPEIPRPGRWRVTGRDARAVELFATCVTCHEYADGRGTFSRPAGANRRPPICIILPAGRGWPPSSIPSRSPGRGSSATRNSAGRICRRS